MKNVKNIALASWILIVCWSIIYLGSTIHGIGIKITDIDDRLYTLSQAIDAGKYTGLQQITTLDQQQVTRIAIYIQQINYRIYPDLAKLYAEYVIRASDLFNIKVSYYLALISIESSFDYLIKSDARCIGLSQINPDVWLDTGNVDNLVNAEILSTKRELYVPHKNLIAGAYVLKHYLNEGVRLKYRVPLRYALARYVGTSISYIDDNPGLKNHRYLNKWRTEIKVIQGMGIR